MADSAILEEYKICNSMVQHLDTQNWNWGAFLFGGTLAATGFVLSGTTTPAKLFALFVISSIILGGWCISVGRSRAVRKIFTERMREIEQKHIKSLKLQGYVRKAFKDGRITIHDDERITIPKLSSYSILEIMVVLFLASLLALTIGTYLHYFQL
jgi:hypothetical protein